MGRLKQLRPLKEFLIDVIEQEYFDEIKPVKCEEGEACEARKKGIKRTVFEREMFIGTYNICSECLLYHNLDYYLFDQEKIRKIQKLNHKTTKRVKKLVEKTGLLK